MEILDLNIPEMKIMDLRRTNPVPISIANSKEHFGIPVDLVFWNVPGFWLIHMNGLSKDGMFYTSFTLVLFSSLLLVKSNLEIKLNPFL